MAGTDLGIEGLSDAEPVGSGGNAVVYRAREVDHDRWVAVKVLRGLADEAALRRFDRERQAMGRLSEHEGIVTIYSSGFTQTGEPYLVMPLLTDSLQDRLDRSGPMAGLEAAALMAVVARTVEIAHGQDVIHRDIKPGNIMMSAADVPLVADFGIARVTGSITAAQSTALTFTPSYSPPEVLAGAAASKAADIYALGATLYALVAGTPPFVTESDENVFTLIQRIATQPVADLRPLGIPDELCVVIETAMHKDPHHRHPTAANLAGALEATIITTPDVAATRVVPHEMPGPAAPAGGYGTRPPDPHGRRRTLTIVGLLALVMVVAAAALVVQSRDNDPITVIAEPDPSSTTSSTTTTTTSTTTTTTTTASTTNTTVSAAGSTETLPTRDELGGVMTYGLAAAGELVIGDDFDVWLFEGVDDDVVTIEMDAGSLSRSIDLQLYRDGSRRTTTGCVNNLARILAYRLTSTATYEIRAYSCDESIGPYTLTLQRKETTGVLTDDG